MRIIFTRLLTIVLLVLALPLSAKDVDKEHQDYFRQFVILQNKDDENAFYELAKRYEQFLIENQLTTAYFKIKANIGFYDLSHKHPFKAMVTQRELQEAILATNDSTMIYLATGLKADVYKAMHEPEKADSTYKVALKEVGNKDKNFTMLTYMNLAEANCVIALHDAKEWAAKAKKEAEEQNNYEYRSMALGMMGYLYFMTADKTNFNDTYTQYKTLKEEYAGLDEHFKRINRQRFSTIYENVMEVARRAFDNEAEEAIELANKEALNVDRQQVIFRIYAMQGLLEKEHYAHRLKQTLIILTCIYIIVYMMGRRRLLRKIQQRNRELKIALDKADAGNRMKSSFIRSMSHEIRTPLNAVNGFSQILCNNDFELSPKEKDNLKKNITSNTEAITIIINELLELAAGESVTLDDSNMLPVNINEVGKETIDIGEKHNRRDLALFFTNELPDNFTIQSNKEIIMKIMRELIHNAMKFTEMGSITIHACQQGNMVELSITDTGIGVPEERQEEIFEDFVKLNDYVEGVGLGLPICRRLAQMLGGTINVDPSYKNGSRFTLRLPLKFKS